MPQKRRTTVYGRNGKHLDLKTVREHCDRMSKRRSITVEYLELIGIDMILSEPDSAPAWHLHEWYTSLTTIIRKLGIEYIAIRNLRVVQPNGTVSLLGTKLKKYHTKVLLPDQDLLGNGPAGQWFRINQHGYIAHGHVAAREGLVELFRAFHERQQESPSLTTLPVVEELGVTGPVDTEDQQSGRSTPSSTAEETSDCSSHGPPRRHTRQPGRYIDMLKGP